MRYFFIEPEVTGGLGKRSKMDRNVHPPEVTHLEYEFDVWRGDVLVEGFPCWIVTTLAATAIRSAKLTGVTFDDVEIVTSDLFRDLYPDRMLPTFSWLKAIGVPGYDDFGVPKSFKVSVSTKPSFARRFTLVISERALNLLRPLGIHYATVSDFMREPDEGRSNEADADEVKKA